MTVLLTRPYDDSARIAERLGDIDTLIWPLMNIVPVMGPDGLRIDEYDAVLFTSAHAVRQIANHTGLPAFCVGTHTANVAKGVGFDQVHDAAGTAGDLVELAKRSGFRRFFYPRGEQVSTDLKQLMAASGAEVKEHVVYRAEATKDVPEDAKQALQNGRIGVVTVWSTRQAAILAKFAANNPKWKLESADLIAISDSAADKLKETGFRRILVASRPDADNMVKTISAAVRQKAD